MEVNVYDSQSRYLSIQTTQSLLGISTLCEWDESESSRSAGISVDNHFRVGQCTKSAESISQVVIRCLIQLISQNETITHHYS